MVKILPQMGNNINHVLNNVKIQQAIFAGITFIIVSHPKVLDFVGKLINVKDKNMLLLIHGVVAGFVNYFASYLIFKPVLDKLIVKEGYKNKKSKK